MIVRTIRCKLIVDQAAKPALEDTCKAFAAGCNEVLRVSGEEGIRDAIGLHKLVYRSLREKQGLSANLAVRAIRRVAASLARKKGPCTKSFRPGSVDYDARLFTFREKEGVVTLRTLSGRLRLALDIGEYQRRALAGKMPTAATLIRSNGAWYLNICVEEESLPLQSEGVMGVDLGLRNIAYASTGFRSPGQPRQQFKEERAKVRASLQSKGTCKTKRVLKKLSGYEKRRIRHENHVLSKQLVDEAKRHNCGVIRMEQLQGIRARTKVWNKHRNRMTSGWSFYQLQQYVAYKAARAGMAVELVDPAYTSQTCHHCGCRGKRDKDVFSCTTCGDAHADENAAWVIAAGGAVVNRPELTLCV